MQQVALIQSGCQQWIRQVILKEATWQAARVPLSSSAD